MSSHDEVSAPESARTITPLLLRDWPLPEAGEDKYSRGSVVVIGGARSTPGAVLLGGTAALRAGAGHLTLAVAQSVAPHVAVALPECGVVGLPESPSGSVSFSSPDAVAEALGDSLKHADAVLVGPGLDDIDEAETLLRGLLAWSASRPADSGPTWVVDAYALGCLPRLGTLLEPWAGRLILTPNPKEAGVLLGEEPEELDGGIAAIAQRYGAVVTCQGVIASGSTASGSGSGPGSRSVQLWRLGTGRGGLGTSGSGDVLAGATAGLRARGASSEQATCWASHLHAAAADRLASRMGPLGFLARELADELPGLLLEMGP
ncbi:ADP/ATP-dependent (S)-NAD(P)H-hydrate dehydratase [Pseudarthrobacter sp. J64]|uniref:ADP-dependent NAD(P)H-hydrate dehydratase n=1 Tax=Pseudarthrobacter sp. J64 TaxID=3116485 RepID=UPI002E7FE814|nr:ADP/ATP-dependent (S)-NAD(P)H-hydrate dehydratase [Pseudarthrobacter sp. J64]MEE2567913.1 ADP/ATP-dependent (S)-NAD(P)H-hydrate dehydratase [Pseudarthrobacter sp. J64]